MWEHHDYLFLRDHLNYLLPFFLEVVIFNCPKKYLPRQDNYLDLKRAILCKRSVTRQAVRRSDRTNIQFYDIVVVWFSTCRQISERTFVLNLSVETPCLDFKLISRGRRTVVGWENHKKNIIYTVSSFFHFATFRMLWVKLPSCSVVNISLIFLGGRNSKRLRTIRLKTESRAVWIIQGSDDFEVN